MRRGTRRSALGTAVALLTVPVWLSHPATAIAQDCTTRTPAFQFTRTAGNMVYLQAAPPSAEAHTRSLQSLSLSSPRLQANPLTVVNVTYVGFTAPAQAAFQYSVDVWKSHISSSVPITVAVALEPLPPNVLGGATPGNFEKTVSSPWYPQALADKIAGTTLDANVPDILAVFNRSPVSPWYYGTDGATPAGEFDFSTVVLHELTHGLGFVGDFSDNGTNGSWGAAGFGGVPTVFDTLVADGSGQNLLSTFTNGSPGLHMQLTGGSLRFTGAQAKSGNGGSAPSLFAPAPWQTGSSVYHTDLAAFPPGSAGALMDPALPPGVAIHDPGPTVAGVMLDLGWSTASDALPGAPVSVSATAGDAQATVSWAPPANSGVPPLSGYTVTASTGASSTSMSVGSSPAILSGLTNGTTYQVSVAATNAVGTGPASAAVGVTPFASESTSTSSTTTSTSIDTTTSSTTTSTVAPTTTTTSSTVASTTTSTSNPPPATTTTTVCPPSAVLATSVTPPVARPALVSGTAPARTLPNTGPRRGMTLLAGVALALVVAGQAAKMLLRSTSSGRRRRRA